MIVSPDVIQVREAIRLLEETPVEKLASRGVSIDNAGRYCPGALIRIWHPNALYLIDLDVLFDAYDLSPSKEAGKQAVLALLRSYLPDGEEAP